MNGSETRDPSECLRARKMKTADTVRPIACVSSVSTDGLDILAPFSSYDSVSLSHPVVLFNTRVDPDDGLSDTARNVVVTGKFVVNVGTESSLERMDRTAELIPPERSEFDRAAVHRAESRSIPQQRVEESPVAMESVVLDTVEIHDRLMVLGEARYVHVSEAVTTDREIDTWKRVTVDRFSERY